MLQYMLEISQTFTFQHFICVRLISVTEHFTFLGCFLQCTCECFQASVSDVMSANWFSVQIGCAPPVFLNQDVFWPWFLIYASFFSSPGTTIKKCCITPRFVSCLEDAAWALSVSWRLCRYIYTRFLLLIAIGRHLAVACSAFPAQKHSHTHTLGYKVRSTNPPLAMTRSILWCSCCVGLWLCSFRLSDAVQTWGLTAHYILCFELCGCSGLTSWGFLGFYDAYVRLCLSETAALALCIGLYVFQQIEGLVNNTAGISP